MADHFYGFNRDAISFFDSDLTIGTSTGSTDLELRIGDATTLTVEDIVRALEILKFKFSTRQITIANAGTI